MSLFFLNKISRHVVKATIYRVDGSMLLQQRDNFPGLLFQNTQTWFGGLAEPGEDLKDALERELIEELGCMTGRIEEELFQWMWSGKEPSVTHIFSVCFLVNEIDLVLMEGKAMKQHSLEEICELESHAAQVQ